MNTSSTQVLGNGEINACLRKAGLFAIHIYNNDLDHVAPALRGDYSELMTHWDIAWSDGVTASTNDPRFKQDVAIALGGVVEQDIPTIAGDSGHFGRLYTPKILEGIGPEDVCPPVLAFRGSEQKDEEFRDLAATVTLVVDVTHNRFFGAPTRDRLGFFLRLDPFEDWEGRTRQRTLDESADLGPLVDLIRSSFVSGHISEPADDTLPTEITRALTAVDLPERQALINSRRSVRVGPIDNIVVDARATVSAHYGSNGDWAANVYQGMGFVGPQYEEAVALADRAVAEARANWNSRLNIVGHSLGGGLAAAAALYVAKQHPDITLGAMTFNAAGLHEQTPRQLAQATLSDAQAIPIRGKVVKDEILHSVGSRGLIPFVSDIFRWQNRFLPAPTGMTDIRTGLSPGLFPVGGSPSHQMDLAADGWRLPFLFPLEQQSMFTNPYRVTYQVPQGYSVGSGGTAPRGYEPSALDALSDRRSNSTPDWGAFAPVDRLSSPAPDVSQVRRLAHMAGLWRQSATFDAAVDATVSYLFSETVDAAFELDLTSLQDDDATWRDYLPGLDRLLQELASEGEILMSLLAASAAYHPMDVAGSTFLRDL